LSGLWALSELTAVSNSNQPAGQRKRRFADFTPLRQSPAFARLYIGTVLSGVGAQMTIVAVGLQIYAITQSTLAVALVGGIALIPMLFAAPIGGMLADSFDRRRVLITSTIVTASSTLCLLALSITDHVLQTQGSHIAVWPFYVFTTINSMAATVTGATRFSVVPRIVPIELIPSASALNGMSMGAQLTLGPALAGVLVATSGYPWTFAADLLLSATGFLGIVTLPRIPPLSEVTRPGWTAFKETLAYLRTTPAVTTGFFIDIIAMTLGRPYVLLPAVGALVIGGGPITVGVLTAAAAIGSFSASLFSGPVKHIHRHGVAIVNAVAMFGLFVMLFGVVIAVMQTGFFGSAGASWSEVNYVALGLACLAFFGTGASDEVSAIFRSSMLLTVVPDDMRGRLQGIFFAVVHGGPRLGDLYAGIAAGLVALWFPPLFGGIVIIVAMFVILRFARELRNYDSRTILGPQA
jgi:MFS family permease